MPSLDRQPLRAPSLACGSQMLNGNIPVHISALIVGMMISFGWATPQEKAKAYMFMHISHLF